MLVSQSGNNSQYDKPYTDYYSPTEENSAGGFDSESIQDKIDKICEWEKQYYEWAHFKGDEEDGPPRPGRHPEPKHDWNIYPERFKRLEETDSEEEDLIRSGLNSKNQSRVKLKSDSQKGKSGVEL